MFEVIDEFLLKMRKVEEVKPKKNGKGNIDECIKLCEESLGFLESFLTIWRKEYEQIPKVIPCRDYLVECYMRKSEFEKAKDVVEFALEKDSYRTKEEGEKKLTFIKGAKQIHVFLMKQLEKNPGIFQNDVYDLLPHIDNEIIDWYFDYTETVAKETIADDVTLWLPEHKSKEGAVLITEEEFLKEKVDNGIFPDWHVSIIFGESTSKKFNEALSIAKKAPFFKEVYLTKTRKKYKSVFNKEQDSFLLFVKLYELAKTWSSTVIKVNDELINEKEFEKIALCYRKKIRSEEENYCYEELGEKKNPFGCHQLGINEDDEPWFTFGSFDSKNIWHLDRSGLKQKINEKEKICRFCPAYQEDKVKEKLYSLPSTIDANWNEEWERSGYILRKKEDNRW